jgi:UDP-N-acetylglucosamine--N-acetylmuramyl-(pentapeptide) pyrophosphoryl-undecaprenol N-acetylglucosamine transferase
MRILFTGGGTGGHLFPIIAVAREIKKTATEQVEMLFVGPKTVGDEILEKENIPKKIIRAGKMRFFSIEILFNFLKTIIGFFQSLWILFHFMPNVVFSKSGFGSVPVVLAAWIFRVPILTHESDSVPGLSARLGAKFSKRVAISFPRAKEYFPPKKTALIGNPIRQELTSGSKEEAKNIFKLEGTKPLVLILGGSQGAQAINDLVISCLKNLLSECEVIHQCGKENFEMIKTLFSGNFPAGYHPYPFLDETELKNGMAAADLIIARAGGGHIFEIAACAKPSILIPLPESAGDHQKYNAYDFSQNGAALVIEQENLTPNFLINRISTLLKNPFELQKMGTAAKSFALPNAAGKIAEELYNIAAK